MPSQHHNRLLTLIQQIIGVITPYMVGKDKVSTLPVVLLRLD